MLYIYIYSCFVCRPQPNIYTQFGSFPAYSALPPAPAASSPANVYNVPLKVEESYESPSGENDEVFYIFYEDKKPAASYESPQYKQPPSPQVNALHNTI